MSTVLIIEDETGVREGLADAVRSLGYEAVAVASLREGRKSLEEHAPDCMLLDIRLKDGDGLELLREMRAGKHRDVPVIVATAYGDSERTIGAMRDGAFDYLTKPFDFPTLLSTVTRAVRQRELASGLPALPATTDARGGLVGASAAMLGIWKLIGRAAAADAPVLITGETGTGKELVARAVHQYSTRAKAPFVGVNLAALPASLIESELFGHERGAFTGAQARRTGRLEAAAEGTLFLDEIGDLDASLQTKLLRVLAEGTFERVGSNEHNPSRVRVVSATHKPVRPGEPGCALREDLYYRLAVIEIEVPPLRARKSDIPLLVAHALKTTSARAVSEEAMARLNAYHWPGNVRELIHVIQRAAALAGGEVIDAVNLPTLTPSPGMEPRAVVTDGEPVTLKLAVASLEAQMIKDALRRANGNRSEAARQLGIGRPQLYAKIDEYKLSDD